MSSFKKHFLFITQCLLFATFILVICSLIYVISLPHSNVLFSNEASQKLTSGWTYTSSDGVTSIVDLSSSLDENIPDGIRISRVLDSSDIIGNTIARYNVMQNCKIYLDDSLLYETPTQGANHVGKTTGTYWIFQRLPDDYAGKTLTLEVTSPFSNYRCIRDNVYFGTKTSILFSIFEHYFWRMIIAFFLVLGSLLCFVFFLFSWRKLHFDMSYLFMCNVMLWIGIWVFSECHLGQLIISNGAFITILAFLSCRMAVISFMGYYMCILHTHWRKWNLILLCICSIELFISTFLQLFNILDFYEILYSFLFVAGLSISSLFMEILVEILFYHSKESRYLFYGSLILLLSVSLDLTILSGSANIHGTFGIATIIGLLILIFIMSIHEIKQVISLINMAHDARYYQHMAITDPMTGCSNRIIMKDWINNHSALTPHEKSHIVILVCDVNNLKIINDQFGHHFGDQAICHIADLLRTSFLDYGVCCRTGGDEFTCLLSDISQKHLSDKINDFLNDISDFNEKIAYPFSASIGYAYYEHHVDASLDHTVYRADQNMYKMKHAYHTKKEMS